jgi:hypothetical protein
MVMMTPAPAGLADTCAKGDGIHSLKDSRLTLFRTVGRSGGKMDKKTVLFVLFVGLLALGYALTSHTGVGASFPGFFEIGTGRKLNAEEQQRMLWAFMAIDVVCLIATLAEMLHDAKKSTILTWEENNE